MPETYKRRYGLDWAPEVHDIQIDLILAKKWRFAPFKYGNLLDPGEHLVRAIKALFTPAQWTVSPWTEENAHAWAAEDFSVWLGAASTEKSNSAGGFAVLDWITDPLDTYIALASTSVPMLKMRSFESVTRYFRILKKNELFLIPGKESASQTAIINDNDSEEADATSKASIRGVALADGDEAKAVARLAGAHMPWVTIILDEGSALPAAAAKARFNAAAGAKRFRFLSLANPVSQHDEATKFCAPIDGWLSVTPETPSWRSQYGLVLHHNGFQSPAVLEPGGAEKYPYLINQTQIDRMLKEVGGNEDDPMIWCMVKGFPAPQGTEATVLSPVDINMFHAAEKAVWGDDVSFVEVAGVDPAFVAEGDGCIMQRARVGMTREGLHSISFYPEDRIPIGVSAPRPGAYQAADGVMKLAMEHGLAMANIAVDDSGTQSVCDILEVESGRKPIRCNFAAKATPPEEGERDEAGKPPKPKYRNMVTEMWHFVAKLVRENQVRDLPVNAAAQLCSRRYRRDVKPLALESKKEYKKRQAGQKSPDEADALAMCCYAAMKVAGLQAGKASPGRRAAAAGAQGGLRKLTVDYTRTESASRFSNYAGILR